MVPRPSRNPARRPSRIGLRSAAAIGAAVAAIAAAPARAFDVSAPAILQDFENTYQSISDRTVDIFQAGYGGLWLPPPGRADSGNQSVGYDVYDRFDLGTPTGHTLYGTQAGLQTLVSGIHATGGLVYSDLVWNHSGFSNTNTTGFAAAGGYPGFAVTLQATSPTSPGYNTLGYSSTYGDYHNPSDTGDYNTRISGLFDIDQSKTYSFIRQPAAASDSRNIPAGTNPLNGRLANVPKSTNTQFYPDQSQAPLVVNDPALGLTNYPVYSFNTASPSAGTPVPETDVQYLARYAQWMVQVIGVDGFRVDAEKNMPPSVMNYLDLATFRTSPRTLLNGQQQTLVSFGEVYDSSKPLLQSYVNKTVDQSTSTVGGNRDVLDYPLYFAMQSNLSSNGAFGSGQNNWNNVVSAGMDVNDDGKHNGSQGVTFVSNHDTGPPSLSRVGYAYTLMMPGQSIVYFNGHEFGTESQRTFPKDGEEAALGGVYGDDVTALVDLRNRYGRGNYKQALVEQNSYAFERQGSCLVLLSNTTDAGFDSRTVPVHFAPGTPLVELTGHAGDAFADPNAKISKVLVVNADAGSSTGASVSARFLRNSQTPAGGSTYSTGDGYLVYGLATPTGSISLTNVARTIHGSVPNASDPNVAFENGTNTLNDVPVIKTATFQLSLHTTQSNLPGYGHDHDADGDLAQIRIDSGIDATGSGLTTDPNSVSYGFGNFTTTNAPGYAANSGAGGDGQYTQALSTAQLGQGYHYITVLAFRHSADPTAPQVYTDWRQTIYIDTAPPDSTLASFSGAGTSRTVQVQSVDGLADNTHAFLDLPASLTDAQVIAMVGSGSQNTRLDLALWQHSFSNLASGNHVITVVSYKPSGTSNVQRFTASEFSALSTATTRGKGVGDLNFDGLFNSTDISSFTTVVQSNNAQFNPAADVNGDGSVDLADTFLLGPVLASHAVDASTQAAYANFLASNYVKTGTYTVAGAHVVYNVTAGTTDVTADSSLSATNVRGNVLTIAAGASVGITQGGSTNGTSALHTLSIAGSPGHWDGTLDLADHALILDYAVGGTPLPTVVDLIRSAYDAGHWDLGGITTSHSLVNAAGVNLAAIAYADNVSLGLPSFAGLPVDATSVLIISTIVGDANMDGTIDPDDYALLDKGFRTAGATWTAGDFNYDGVVDQNDYLLIDAALEFQGGPLSLELLADREARFGAAYVQALAASVPEPGVCGPLTIAFAVLTSRRKAKRKNL